MNRKKVNSFNDGILYIYEQKQENNSFASKKNPRSIDDLKEKGYLFFKYENMRKEDFLFALNKGRKLTTKVKTQLNSLVETSDKVIIENHLFDVITLDPDIYNKELYFYLEEVRTIER